MFRFNAKWGDNAAIVADTVELRIEKPYGID